MVQLILVGLGIDMDKNKKEYNTLSYGILKKEVFWDKGIEKWIWEDYKGKGAMEQWGHSYPIGSVKSYMVSTSRCRFQSTTGPEPPWKEKK